MQNKLFHAARILAAIILLQTLYFKFLAHPESVELFTKIGMEPEGRITTGIIELIAGVLLLFGGRFVRLGAGIGVLLMLGAIYYHLTIIGLDQLFIMAVVTFICCIYVLRWSHKESHNLSAVRDGMVQD